MPLEDQFALKIFENGKDAMTIEFAKSLIPIIFKHVDNIEIRNQTNLKSFKRILIKI